MTDIAFTAPPTGARFCQSDSFGRLIAGPVGSGKTTTCIFELLRRAIEQTPGDDGVRYTRFAIVRQTLEQLRMTVLKDVLTWLKGIATYKVTDKTIFVRIDTPTLRVSSEWILIPLEDPEDRQRLLSSQLTGVWMSEAIEMDISLISDISGRCARYPYGAEGAPTWAGIIADTNMPPEGSAWHSFMELKTPPDWQIFIQPGGLAKDEEGNWVGENLNWLNQTDTTRKLPLGHPERIAQGLTYYTRLRDNATTPDYVKRYVNAEYGDDPHGAAVFAASFNRRFHVAESLEPLHDSVLLIGQDFGRDPWSLITQVDRNGRMLVLEEVPAEDVGLEVHLTRNLLPVLSQRRYLGMQKIICGDPAGGAKDSLFEVTSFDVLKARGFMAFPAPTNALDPRLRAVEEFLLRQAGGGPAMLLDKSRCPTIIRALDGGYRFGRTRTGYKKPTPDKNEYSHVADALQYAALAVAGGEVNLLAEVRRQMVRNAPPPPAPSSRAWT